MKLIDRISLQRLLSMVFSFIITIIKLLVPQNGVDNKGNNPRRKRIFPRINKDDVEK